MWAALAYRRWQTLFVLLLSASVTACVVLAPLLTNSLGEGILKSRVERLDSVEALATLRVGRTPGHLLTGADLAAEFPRAATPWFGEGIGGIVAPTQVATRPGALPSPVSLRSRDRLCDHVRMRVGRCPHAAGEVAVSAADARNWGWAPGQDLIAADLGNQNRPVSLAIVGVYDEPAEPAYWLGAVVTGKSGLSVPLGTETVAGVDDLLTAPQTFEGAWSQADVSVQYPLARDRLTVESLARLDTALVLAPGTLATLTSPVPNLQQAVASGQHLLRLLIPLLLAQLAMLVAAVAFLTVKVAVGQRRPEVALARLRGYSSAASRRRIVTELAIPVVLGLPVGVAIALAGDAVIRALLLPSGVSLEVGWPLWAAAILGTAVTLAASVVASRELSAESILDLLRRSAPHAEPGWLARGVFVVLAVVGVVGIATRSLTGPLALATPMVLALAVGLTAGAGLVRIAGRMGARTLTRRPPAVALAWFSVARRPELRSIVTIVTMASALTVFAVNAVVVADRNRANRAELEVGAAVALVTDATRPADVAQALSGLPAPLRDQVMPVGLATPRDASAGTTLALRPGDYRRLGFQPAGGPPLDLAALADPEIPSVKLTGQQISGRLRWVSATGQPSQPAEVRFGVTVRLRSGEILDRDLASVSEAGSDMQDFAGPLLCSQGCELHGLWLRRSRAVGAPVEGVVTLATLAVDGIPLPVLDPALWHPDPTSGGGRMLSVGRSSEGLALNVVSDGGKATALYGDVPERVPAILAGRAPSDEHDGQFSLFGLSGRPVPARIAQRVPALPVVLDRGVLVNFDTMARLGGELPADGTVQVWTDQADPSTVSAVTEHLQARGIRVRTVERVSEHLHRYQQSATGWGLGLEVVTSVAAVLVAAVVLLVVAATSWRMVARDLASLQAVGLSRRQAYAAVSLEQTGISAVAVLLGLGCGLVGAWLAMPLIPLFDTPVSVPTADLTPSLLGMAGAAGGCFLVVGAMGLAVAASMVSRATPDRLRESW